MSGAIRAAVFLCAMSLAANAVDAAGVQKPGPPPAAFRYTSDQLACVTFHEHSQGQLDAQTGTRQRRETLLRDGILRLEARPARVGIALEAWYDSLAISRDSPEGRLEPDTDGLLGGRYRGTLTPSGHYVPDVRPFVPDEVAEVADIGMGMDDLLPPLPSIALVVGGRWSDSSGVEFRRLPDSAAGGRTVRRLALSSRTETDRAAVRGDTARLAARQVTVEDGRVDWDAAVGLLRRTRRIVVEMSVPAGGRLREPLRSRLQQDVVVERSLPDACR